MKEIVKHDNCLLERYIISDISEETKELWLKYEHDIENFIFSTDYMNEYKGYKVYYEKTKKDKYHYIKKSYLYRPQLYKKIKNYQDLVNYKYALIYIVEWISKEQYIREMKNKFTILFSKDNIQGIIYEGVENIPSYMLESSDENISLDTFNKYNSFTEEFSTSLVLIFGIFSCLFFNGGWFILILCFLYIIYGISQEVKIEEKYGPKEKKGRK